LQAVFGQAEDAAVGDVEHGPAGLNGLGAAEGALFDCVDELWRGGCRVHDDATVFNMGAAGREEGTEEEDFFGVLADVDEPATASELGSESADIDIALAVDLSHAEECGVEAPAVVKIELVGLVDDGVRVDRDAEVQRAGRHPADDTGFGGQCQIVEDVFFSGDAGDAFGHTDAEVDDTVCAQRERCAASDDLSFVQRHGCRRAQRYVYFAAECGGVDGAEGLPVVFWRRDNDAVDQHSGNLDLARVE